MDAVSCVQREITIVDLVNLRKCQRTLEFSELSLNYKGFESAKVVRKALDSLKQLKEINQETAYKKIEEIFESEYRREWFNFQFQYEQALERDMIRVKRIVKYICDKSYTIIDTDVPFKILINSLYRSYQISNIIGKVDFVFGNGDEVVCVNILSGENPYSYQAKKIENFVGNSMELLGTALGISGKYPDRKIAVESWYIKHKDDKTYSLVEVYEDKKGKNIARIEVSNTSDVRDRFYQSATFMSIGANKCDTCLHKGVCRASFEVKKPVKIENSESKAAETKVSSSPRFTDEQKAVVDHMEGPMCVIAGPGAGKTFTLVMRIVNMLRKGIRPESILVVTFTKKAVAEIKERVMKLLGYTDEKQLPSIYTYNAIGFTILKENPMFLGKRVKLADKMDRYVLIGKALENAPQVKNVSYDGIYSDYGLIRNMEGWFNKIDEKGREAFENEYRDKKDVAGIFKVYDLYSQYFTENGYINYDMQISLVNDLFQKHPKIVTLYAMKYQYIMIDEFQDTCEAQAKMIYSIAKKHGNIVVVGDDDQSIYGWRGGSNEFMLNFRKDYPNTKFVLMNDNFRSTNTILDAANVIIANNGNRYEKSLQGHNEASYKPIYLKGYMANDVVGLIKAIHSKGYQLGDIAILARNHKRLAEVYEVLNGYYKVSSPKELLYEDTVFQSLYDILTLYYKGMEEDEALYRVLRVCGVNIVKKEKKHLSLHENLVSSNQLLKIDKMDIECLSSYEKYHDVSDMMAAGYKIISCFKKIQYGKGVNALIEVMSVLFGFTEHIVVKELLDIADERSIITMAELYAYMDNMILFRDERSVEYEPNNDSINLLTSHSSKGKEFPVVIVYGTEDFRDDEEEIRLFYVSITRAKNTLFFIETACNKCDLLPRLIGSVEVK